jgi:hypothetical protein
MHETNIGGNKYWEVAMITKKIPILCHVAPRGDLIIKSEENIEKLIRENKEKVEREYKKKNDKWWGFSQCFVKEVFEIEYPETYKYFMDELSK